NKSLQSWRDPLCLTLTATPEGLRVRQHPPSLSVIRGETATLSCHFKVESLKYGVQWFKSEHQLITNSSRQIVVAKNQTSSLVITNTTIQDSGWYYCEVNVLKKDPEWGNGTKLVVLGKKQIGGFRNEHAHNLLGPLRLGDVAMLICW
uniref:Ig-like domain-containing protein n=1 Tax=Oreochromis niloticus TaxID=8128 RepID=A0A669BB68_ORENI